MALLVAVMLAVPQLDQPFQLNYLVIEKEALSLVQTLYPFALYIDST